MDRTAGMDRNTELEWGTDLANAPQPTLPTQPLPTLPTQPLPTLPTQPLPTLPTLPPADVAPTLPLSTVPEAALPAAPLPSPFDAGTRHAPLATPPSRPDPRAGAAYGSLPGKPRASEPSEAARRANEQRRQAKKRRRVRRIAVLVIAIVVGVLAGPPAVRWITNELERAAPSELPTDHAPDSADAGD